MLVTCLAGRGDLSCGCVAPTVTRKQGPRGDKGQGCGLPDSEGETGAGLGELGAVGTPTPSAGRGGSPCLLFPVEGGWS